MQFRDFTRAVRTRQWAKNALIFGGFLFAGYLRQPPEVMVPALSRVLLAFLVFCALSGAAYLLNDWQDLERDRLHPTKKERPLASGRVSLRSAFVLLGVLLLVAVGLTLLIGFSQPSAWGFGVAALGYFALTLLYSLRLKHEVVLDVLAVATGFVLRVVAGCLVIPVEISPWILLCTFNLALFIALCKRRAELIQVGDEAGTRDVLKGYSAEMLDTFISVAAGLTIISYSFYTFTAEHRDVLGVRLAQTPLLMATIPFVVYGVFRYLLLAHSTPVGGEPERMLRDRPLVVSVALWALCVAFLTLLPTLP